MSPEARVRGAWVVLVVCLVAWPLTSATIFKEEPQAVLALSWVALILQAVLLIATTDVRREQDEEADGR